MRAQVHQFGSHFADDVHPQQFLFYWGEDQLDHPVRVTNDLAAPVVGVVGPPHQAGEILLPALVLCQAGHGDLRNGVDRQRHHW